MCDVTRSGRRAPSSAARVGLLLMGALLAAGGGPLAAQQTEEELVHHLRDVIPRLDSARLAAEGARAADAARRAHPDVASIDTFQVGPLHILAPSDQRKVAESFFRDVWESDYASFVTTSPVLAKTTFTFQWSPEPGRIPVRGDVRRVELRAWRPASAVHAAVVTAISTALGEDLPEAVVRWGGSGVRDHTALAGVVFRELTVSPARSNRACLKGNPAACWTSLGLDVGDPPLAEWYTPDERRLRVAALRTLNRSRVPTWNACVVDRSTQACDLYLMQWYPFPPITNDVARKEMVWVALRSGGTGAWDRLRADANAAPAEALRAASGMSSEELGARWRAWALEGAPPTRAVLDSHLLVHLLWIVAFAALATRSTRWRLG